MTGPIFLYCFITFFITWGIVLPSYFFFRNGVISQADLNLIYNLGALGPFVASYICCWLYYGKSGVQRLVKSLQWKKVSKKTWLMSLFPFLLVIVAFLTYPLFMDKWFSFSETKRQFNLVNSVSYLNWILPFITYSILEEFGWRGFLLPHLQNKFTAIKSTLILGSIWAIWHAPFFLWRFQFSIFVSIGFFVSIMIGAIILTSLYNLGRGSIIPVIMFHFANNMSAALDREYFVIIVSAGLVFLAVYMFNRFGKENLSDGPRITFLNVKPTLLFFGLGKKKKAG